MDSGNIPFGLAFLAGLASFLSPCVLCLVPAYLGYLGSRTITAEGQVIENRWVTFTHGLAFVLGFSAVFIALGSAASAIGALFYDFQDILTKIGGVVVILFGLHTLGLIHIPFLDYDTRHQQAPDRRWGYLSSALMGVFFSAGWSPCVGPVLGAVLTLALSSGAEGRGAALLSAYSLGLGIPFLFVAAGLGSVSEFLRRYNKYLRYVSQLTGIFLIVIGVMLFANSMSYFARFAPFTEFQVSLDQRVVDFWDWLTRRGG